MPLAAVPGDMAWDEALRAITILRSDPSSAIAAAIEGWDYPIDRTTLALYDLYDLTVMANSDPKKGRPTPHNGRPFKMDTRETAKVGNAAGRSPAQVLEALRGVLAVGLDADEPVGSDHADSHADADDPNPRDRAASPDEQEADPLGSIWHGDQDRADGSNDRP